MLGKASGPSSASSQLGATATAVEMIVLYLLYCMAASASSNPLVTSFDVADVPPSLCGSAVRSNACYCCCCLPGLFIDLLCALCGGCAKGKMLLYEM